MTWSYSSGGGDGGGDRGGDKGGGYLHIGPVEGYVGEKPHIFQPPQ